jgi:glycosyltransferase involved in cell wall biosynthesis
MRVAFIHDWLVTHRGGEKVLEALLGLYPEAPIYTMFYDPRDLPPSITDRKIIVPQFWNRLRKWRKLLFPLYPAIIESFDLSGYDLVISTSSCAAKAAIPAVHAKHLCYIHSPMRYVWDQMDAYMEPLKSLPGARSVANLIAPWLRLWDVATCNRVDQFVANSRFVQQRVQRYYGRESVVVHPPIALEHLRPNSKPTRDYFLVAGAFVPYKRIDLAIQACESLGQRLIVAGAGPMEKQLRSLGGTKTEWVISPNDNDFRSLLQNAKALIMPGIEDFGMIPVEAIASGTPVVAFRGGGALDFVRPGSTGAFFETQDVSSLRAVLEEFRIGDYDTAKLTWFANQFSLDSFLSKVQNEIALLME